MSDSPADNPYASPGLGPAQPLPLRPLAPARRVEFAGTIEYDDRRPSERTNVPRLALVSLCGAIGVTVIAFRQVFEGDFHLALVAPAAATFVAALCILLTLVFASHRIQQSQQRQKYRPEPVSGWFAEDAIELVTPHFRQTLGWPAFAGFESAPGGPPIVWLLRPGAAPALPMPRRFFGSEDDWRRFVELVARRLPATDRAVPAPAPANARELETSGIRFNGFIEARHLARARRLLGVNAWNSKAWQFWGMLAAFQLYIGFLFLRVDVDEEGRYITAGLLICIPLAAAVFYYLQRRARQAERFEFRGAAEETGLRVATEQTEFVFRWEAYLGRASELQPTPILVLRLPNNEMHVLPREIFASDKDWERCHALAVQAVRQSS